MAPAEDGGAAFIIHPMALPVMLKEGESCSEFTDVLEAAGKNVKELFVYDSTGKNWRLSRRELKKLKKECSTRSPSLTDKPEGLRLRP